MLPITQRVVGSVFCNTFQRHAAMLNKAIRAYLLAERDRYITLALIDAGAAPFISDLKSIDYGSLSQAYLHEMLENSDEWWPMTEVPFDALLFEYDYLGRLDPTAESYGLRAENPADLKRQTEPYFLGYAYDFAQPIEATPGITLRLLNPLSTVESTNAVELMSELKTAYLYAAFVALHDAITEFVSTDSFNKLLRLSPFHFLIQEHDSLTQPLYIVE
ncbi:hypothetical protein [Fibrella aquatilis]|uniref:Uncharacterized protein n=1 Tax=Fibrella aquatilis TaxID=2817059 RepID=A0A939G100_9BACT|nr:hypothetical protein [Fibrella aquatilis]MBO0929866.1 hypothetical protein [Fibrella aquatilis]